MDILSIEKTGGYVNSRLQVMDADFA